MRELVTSNARYWIDEFHLDGLRLDATQQIFDSSQPHILAEIGQSARAAAEDRKIYIVCENEPQDVRLVKPSEDSGYGFDALWNDDFHHSATVAATGQERAYFSGFLGTPQEFISAAKYGFLFQGQYYEWQGKPRGSSTFGLPAGCFVNFIQNHDQIANTGFGNRIHELTSFGCYKALTALTILLPGSPMLFQGQEFMASSPFLFFADHATEIADAVRSGRAEFLAQFPNLADPSAISLLPAPDARDTFLRCVLDHDERHIGRHAQILELHRDLIRLRVMDDILAMPSRSHIDGAVLSNQAFLLRWWGEHHHDLLLVNLGRDLTLIAVAEPLLAPPSDVGWTLIWDSEDVRYGGAGVLPVSADRVWKISACSAILLRAPMPPGQ
jgi:maltooligosyltrehalose trehalohydrolase